MPRFLNPGRTGCSGAILVRSDLIAALAKKYAHLETRDIDLLVRLVFESMSESLAAGQRIELRGFGSFFLKQHNPRQARNPGTGQVVSLGPRRSVRFKTSALLEARLNPDAT